MGGNATATIPAGGFRRRSNSGVLGGRSLPRPAASSICDCHQLLQLGCGSSLKPSMAGHPSLPITQPTAAPPSWLKNKGGKKKIPIPVMSLPNQNFWPLLLAASSGTTKKSFTPSPIPKEHVQLSAQGASTWAGAVLLPQLGPRGWEGRAKLPAPQDCGFLGNIWHLPAQAAQQLPVRNLNPRPRFVFPPVTQRTLQQSCAWQASPHAADGYFY